MNFLQRAYWTVGAVGWENVPRRVRHLVEDRLRIKRVRLPAGNVSARRLVPEFVAGYRPAAAAELWGEKRRRFFALPQVDQSVATLQELADEQLWRVAVTDKVRRLRSGEFQFFSQSFHSLGQPVNFQFDPVQQRAWPTGQHWSTYNTQGLGSADIKYVWEPSRFAAAFCCAREHVRHPAAGARETFWQLFHVWDDQNPYGSTVNWVCGQEATFRLMAWLFAALVMCDGVGNATEYHRLTELVWHTGRHLEKNIVYARSQKNNHAISEAAGLWTIGLLFPELRRSASWRDQGRRILIEETARQIYDDGSFVQHSLNYHRLMLDVLGWAVQLGRWHGDELAESQPRLGRALDWLLAMISPESGRVPNYGANDGALVLPLSCCDYLDFRPTAQALSCILGRPRPFGVGPWDEQVWWLCGPAAVRRPGLTATRRPLIAAPDGGYYTLAGDRSWALVRAHSYRDRPSQADMLHLDLWYDGQNVLRDGGSFRYRADAPWSHYFSSTAAHNTVEVDGVSQMDKGPRFLWLRWTRTLTHEFRHSPDGRCSWFDAEHDGYRRLTGDVVHRRRILRCEDSYLIEDHVLGQGSHEVTLRWRLGPTDWQPARIADLSGWVGVLPDLELGVAVQVPEAMRVSLVCGEAGLRPEGWESLYYGERHAVPTLVVRGQVALPVCLTTMVGPVGCGNRNRASGPATHAQDTAESLQFANTAKLLDMCRRTRSL